MPDVGLTHIALPAHDLDASVAFYAKYAHMQVAHRRADPATAGGVVWLTDGRRPCHCPGGAAGVTSPRCVQRRLSNPKQLLHVAPTGSLLLRLGE